MRFREFIEKEGFNEIWDYLADPNALPVVMGAAGMGGAALAKAGKWAMDKFSQPGRESRAMKDAYDDLMQAAQQFGVDSPQVNQAMQSIQSDFPGLVSMAQNQLQQMKSQQQPSDDGNILPMVRTPQSANRIASRPRVGGLG